jgi:hypothetical protein
MSSAHEGATRSHAEDPLWKELGDFCERRYLHVRGSSQMMVSAVHSATANASLPRQFEREPREQGSHANPADPAWSEPASACVVDSGVAAPGVSVRIHSTALQVPSVGWPLSTQQRDG